MPLWRRFSGLRSLPLETWRCTVSRTTGTIVRYGHFALPTELNPGFALVFELTVLLVVATRKVLSYGSLGGLCVRFSFSLVFLAPLRDIFLLS